MTWRERWALQSRQRVRVRPTREGWWFLLLVVGVTLGAFNTGNNLLYLCLSALLSLLVIQNVLAEWNLRAARLRRRLPAELFSFEQAEGAYVLWSLRPGPALVGIQIEELDEGGAQAEVSVVPPTGEVEVQAAFTFGGRGWQRLGRVRVSSTWPFGLFLRYRELELGEAALVFPARRPGGARAGGAERGAEEETPRRRGGAGEPLGARPYVEGDPIRSVHWPTSARVGRPMVVERAGEEARSWVVRVDVQSPQVEDELARACGQIVTAMSRGERIGLELGDERLSPQHGGAHRRRLLTALALFERGP